MKRCSAMELRLQRVGEGLGIMATQVSKNLQNVFSAGVMVGFRCVGAQNPLHKRKRPHIKTD
jgi:hypothetical protein